jgi:VanZ family protein
MRKTQQTSIWHRRFTRYVPFIFWVGVIFFLSSDSGSMENTGSLIRNILGFFLPTTPEEILAIYHVYIRKFAHFTEYGILAFWASRAFLHSSKYIFQRYWLFWSFGIVVFVAAIDEFNQSFNANRTGSIGDFFLDCFGGVFVIISIFIYLTVSKRQPNSTLN